jgi:CDP-diacylglycerol--glycerol-3-phosphate 3-phosphatidyltransferase
VIPKSISLRRKISGSKLPDSKVSMRKLLLTLPALLICIRFALGPIIWWSVYNKISPWWFLAGFIIAYLTDIFDGIIARKLGVATPALRLADSWVDTWFYFWVVLSVWTTHFESLQRFAIPIYILLALQISEWIYGRIKFGKMTGYHAYIAKAWGISLFFAIFSVMLFDYDGIIWWVAMILGWVSSIENWLLTLTFSTWTTDVKSIIHVWRSKKV